MARNKVRFHRGLSDVEFERLYGTEEKYREALFSGVGRRASNVRRVESPRTASSRGARCGSATPAVL